MQDWPPADRKRFSHLRAGRLGGEKFVVLLPQINRQQVPKTAERLRLMIAAGEVRQNGIPNRFTASFRAVTIDSRRDSPDKKMSIDDLLIQADSAMYQAKKNGRNQVCLGQDNQDI
jgi:diguanylate cyclase (GGDEF)-like protein